MIVLDVMLPDISGPEALPLFRNTTYGATAAVVFLTAKAGVGVREGYLALGAQDVLFKPFDPMTLPDQLAQVWAGLNQG
jgi:CheY-like chemotaxis protein